MESAFPGIFWTTSSGCLVRSRQPTIRTTAVPLSMPVQGMTEISSAQWQGCPAETGHPIARRLPMMKVIQRGDVTCLAL